MPRGKVFASSTRQSGTVKLIILIVLCFLFFRILASQEQSPSTGPTPTDRPIPPLGDASFDCQPEIEVGKTINVVYHAVRVRHSPGYAEKDDAQDTQRHVKTSDQVVVIDGPMIKDGLCWWVVTCEDWQG